MHFHDYEFGHVSTNVGMNMTSIVGIRSMGSAYKFVRDKILIKPGTLQKSVLFPEISGCEEFIFEKKTNKLDLGGCRFRKNFEHLDVA